MAATAGTPISGYLGDFTMLQGAVGTTDCVFRANFWEMALPSSARDASGFSRWKNTNEGQLVAVVTARGYALSEKFFELPTNADVAGEFVVARTDDAGIGGTALTENALDPLSPAATVAGVGGTFTTDPASTANGNLLMIPLNQRATFTWLAREGFELLSALVAGDGIMCECTGMSSGTPNMNCTMAWFE